jgi:hypothetical protein
MSLLNNIFGAGAQQALGGQDPYEKHIAEHQRYATATQNHLANQYSQNLAQSMMNTKQAVSQSIMAQAQIKPFNPNESEAYKVPLSQLVTLWQAKFGDQWVEIFEEDFWRDALSRLKVANKLEIAHHWFRIKEDA